jgi:hypothetical protein
VAIAGAPFAKRGCAIAGEVCSRRSAPCEELVVPAPTENCALPITDVGFGKVSKHLLCEPANSHIRFRQVAEFAENSATLLIHPCTSLTVHEPLPKMIGWLLELVQEPHDGS